jgi:hypothetical protein
MKPNKHKMLKRVVYWSFLIFLTGLSGLLNAQTIRVTGKVVDKDKQPIPGVNIVIEGTTTGVSSNVDGDYFIDVKSTSTLIFSYMGMITQKLAVNGNKIVNVTMVEDVQSLNEVVVIGYGTRLKGAVTGAIAQTDSKVFEMRPIVNTLDGLQGVLPGVTITRSSGRPGGEGYSVQIRGFHQ